MRARRRAQGGQALAEMLITFAWGVPLLLAIIQLGLMYRAKATLNDATFRAARAGSLHHAYTSDMKHELVRSMVPTLYAVPPGETPSLATYTVRREALDALYGIEAHPIAKVDVVSPTAKGFREFSKPAWGLTSDCGRGGCPNGGDYREVDADQRLYEIPNDNLEQRPTTLVDVDGRKINVQDANLLKIRTLWCQEMKVPGINRLVWEAVNLSGLFNSADWRRCSLLRAAQGGYYFPLSSHAVVRMQTPVRCEGNPRGNTNCKNLR
ncbi:TadE/TadG family type IV pilus assembly protein [Alloalcanivorax sp. C16-2]|uniref:TadE/TadG family type IV pilus assembly protein n=1 Tax=Alloalcanivorax TaxID=3020832 RepID=UPI001931EC49|nr:TadE family protein [Alloalcanivorax marinus]MBL7250930.1 pilus assembly protein [Alloalcanivorax marinus]